MAKSTINPSQSFWDHPVKNLEEALHLRKQIEALQEKLSALIGGTSSEASKPIATRTPKFSTPAPAEPTAVKSKGRKAAVTPAKKTGLTPEGRAKLAASMKARWAARKAAAGQ